MMRIRLVAVRHVAVVQQHLHLGVVRVPIKMIDAVRIKGRGATLDAVHLVAFLQQKLRQVGSVLACNSGD